MSDDPSPVSEFVDEKQVLFVLEKWENPEGASCGESLLMCSHLKMYVDVNGFSFICVGI